MQDLQLMVEEEQRGRDDAREAASKAERRVGEIASELEELRAQLEQVWWLYFTFHCNKCICVTFSVLLNSSVSKLWTWRLTLCDIYCKIPIIKSPPPQKKKSSPENKPPKSQTQISFQS